MAASQAGEVNNINSKAKIGTQAGKVSIIKFFLTNYSTDLEMTREE